jgi:hypothetical protein
MLDAHPRQDVLLCRTHVKRSDGIVPQIKSTKALKIKPRRFAEAVLLVG